MNRNLWDEVCANTRTTVHKESQGHYNTTGVSKENRLKHWKKKKIKIKVATECILLSNMWIKGCDGNKTFLQDVDFISHVEGRKY